MKAIAVLLGLGLAACGDGGGREATGETAVIAPPAAPTAPQSTVAGTPSPTKAALLAVPEDKGELQRMIDLGYSPHDDHLHPPGVKECPLMGGDMVQ